MIFSVLTDLLQAYVPIIAYTAFFIVTKRQQEIAKCTLFLNKIR